MKRSTSTIHWGLACCLMLVLGACDLADPIPRDEGSELDLELRPGTIGVGSGWGCRTCNYANSPECGPYQDVPEFSRNELPGAGSPWLGSIRNPMGFTYGVTVEHDQFVAHTLGGPLTGGALIGWTLVYKTQVAEFNVEITAFEMHEDWVHGDLIPTYGLVYDDLSGGEPQPVNVCPGYSPEQTSIVLIENERYDEVAKIVLPGENDRVTMACQGHALAKMKFSGYDPNDGYGSSPEQRQATIKMFTADYCGTGQSFTVLGQPLQWIDGLWHFTEQDLPYLGAVEARWTDQGAECLDVPRHVTREQVDDACSIPTCDGDPDLGGADWVTLLP